MTAPRTNESMSLQTLMRVLRQRRGVILTSVMVFAMLGVLINTLTPPVYRATTRIEIRRTPEVTNNFQSDNQSMMTAAALITNRALLGRLADEYQNRPGWIHGGSQWDELVRAGTNWLRSMHVPVGDPGPQGADPALRSKQIDWLETIVSVEPLRDTRLVDLHVEHTNPVAARTMADRLIQRFVEYQTRRTNGPDSSRTAPVAGGAETTKPMAVPGTMARAWTRARLHALGGQVTNTQSEYYRVRSERMDAQNKLSQLERYANDSSADVTSLPIDDPAIENLRRDVIACQTRVASAKEVYREHHPQLTQIASECATLRASLRRELQRAASEQRTLIAQLTARENDLNSTLNQSTMEIGAVEEQNDVEQQANVANPIPTWVPPVELVDPATIAPDPVRPRKLLNLAICVVIGSMVGTGFALLRHSLRHTIRTPEDVEAELGLEVLGVIPKKTYAASW
jgi:polysaccharide biosynthesis transport protein